MYEQKKANNSISILSIIKSLLGASAKKGENIGNSIINPIYLFRNRKFSLILIVNDIQQTKTSTNISFVFDYSTTNIQGEMKGKLQYIFHRFSDFLVCIFFWKTNIDNALQYWNMQFYFHRFHEKQHTNNDIK